MPQRHRPRLKRTTFRCDQCGATAMKLYPSREIVRARMSPYRFCSSTCQREHWEARRKDEWVAVVYPCRQCGKTLRTAQAPGRRRDYCSDACKQRAARERSRRNPAGAVVAARQRCHEAWRQAVIAISPLEMIYAHGRPALIARQQLRDLPEETEEEAKIRSWSSPFSHDGVSFEERTAIRERREARADAVRRVGRTIQSLKGPRYPSEPDREKAVDYPGPFAQAWANWWNGMMKGKMNAYQQSLLAAREASADLRKSESVAARRAETARLRRAAGKGNPPV